MAKALLKIIVMCAVWGIPRIVPKKKEQIDSFCAGFCTAEALAVLCGRCAWMYSVVFGELFGFVMLSVTVLGAVCLFNLLSGANSNLLLTSIYVFFSSAESEYQPLDTPIINAMAKGVRLGGSGMSDSGGKRTAVLLVFAAAGCFVSVYGNGMPSAFGAISCCALLCRGMKNISSDRHCCIGAAVACLLSYL